MSVWFVSDSITKKIESGSLGLIYTSEKSDVRFFSHAPLEDIEARFEGGSLRSLWNSAVQRRLLLKVC
jgi:hypothetical protein